MLKTLCQYLSESIFWLVRTRFFYNVPNNITENMIEECIKHYGLLASEQFLVLVVPLKLSWGSASECFASQMVSIFFLRAWNNYGDLVQLCSKVVVTIPVAHHKAIIYFPLWPLESVGCEDSIDTNNCILDWCIYLVSWICSLFM